jgi:hypothetical protein
MEVNIRVGPDKIWYKVMSFVNLLQDILHWRVLVKSVVKFLVSCKVGNSLLVKVLYIQLVKDSVQWCYLFNIRNINNNNEMSNNGVYVGYVLVVEYSIRTLLSE